MNILIKGALSTSIVLLASTAFAGGPSTFNQLHPASAAVQLGPNFIALAYYTDRHQFTLGAEVSSISSKSTDGGTSTTSPFFALAFARYNAPLTSHTVLGFGAMYGRDFANKDTADSFTTAFAAPYLAVEYSPTSHISLGVSFRPVTYQKTEKPDNATTWSYFTGGSLQLAYRF